MPEQDPIKKIEDETAFRDMGKMGFLVYHGALAEGNSRMEAFLVTAAYFRGIAGGSMDHLEDEDENSG